MKSKATLPSKVMSSKGYSPSKQKSPPKKFKNSGKLKSGLPSTDPNYTTQKRKRRPHTK